MSKREKIKKIGLGVVIGIVIWELINMYVGVVCALVAVYNMYM